MPVLSLSKRSVRLLHHLMLFGFFAAILGIVACAGHVAPLAVPPAMSPPAAATPSPHRPESRLPAIQFTIQVGAFSTPGRAARYAEHLQSAGLDAYFFIDEDGLSKVRFERFETKETAYDRAAGIRAQGLIDDFFIVHPRPESANLDPLAALQESLVKTACRFIGTAYRWGGTSRRDGFDCSGLTMTVYRLNGLELPRSAYGQYRAGTPVSREALRAGDLVFFATGRGKSISHVGIYSGQGRFIHAPGRGKSIRSASLSNSYFKSRYKGARRYY